MTIVEIDDTVGLHDAVIYSIFVDYAHKEARFDLDVCICDPDSPNYDEACTSRRGMLEISNLFFFINKPHDEYDIVPGLDILSTSPVEPEELPVKIENPIPDNVFINAIYTDRSAIYIAAVNAEFEWTE